MITCVHGETGALTDIFFRKWHSLCELNKLYLQLLDGQDRRNAL